MCMELEVKYTPYPRNKRKASELNVESSELSTPPLADNEYDGHGDSLRGRESGSRKEASQHFPGAYFV